MVMLKIKRDDEVVVVAGKDKGKRGKVLKVLENSRVLVSGIQMIKKDQEPRASGGVSERIIEKESPIQVSDVAIINRSTKKADRVGLKSQGGSKEIRVFKASGEAVDA